MDLSEIKKLIEAQGVAWQEYKTTNDERIEKLAKNEAVSDHEAKLGTIDTRLNEIAAEVKEAYAKANKAATFGRDIKGEAEAVAERKEFELSAKAHASRYGRAMPAEMEAEQYGQYKSVFRDYLRKGTDNFGVDERKAVNIGTDPDGGYLVDAEMDGAIGRVALNMSAFRQVARVITIGANSYKKLVKTSGVGNGGWGGETTAPSETGTPGWSEITIVPGENWAEPRSTTQALEDAGFNVEQDLINEIGITFADSESQAFIDGDGVDKPRGVLDYDIVANSAYSWGKLGSINSGNASAFPATKAADAFIDLQHALRRNYRAGAVWMMNDATLGQIRKFKDANDLYLWAPSGLIQGAIGQLLGHPVVSDDFMPDVGADAYPVAFGDFNNGYTVVDRRGLTILRDPYTAKPYVKFYARRRVGGGILNFEAIKLMKIAS